MGRGQRSISLFSEGFLSWTTRFLADELRGRLLGWFCEWLGVETLSQSSWLHRWGISNPPVNEGENEGKVSQLVSWVSDYVTFLRVFLSVYLFAPKPTSIIHPTKALGANPSPAPKSACANCWLSQSISAWLAKRILSTGSGAHIAKP